MARAVAEIDAPSTGVATSPVKRILRLETLPVPMYRLAGAGGTPGGSEVAAATPGSETTPLTPNYTVSPTGRTSNGMYDVVPFSLTADVEAGQVNQFIHALTHDRLIYVDQPKPVLDRLGHPGAAGIPVRLGHGLPSGRPPGPDR